MKFLLIPAVILAFILFLLLLGAIGLAIAFAMLLVFGRIWRLISGGGGGRQA